MLTLKEPIKLNIDDGFLTVSEGLFQRILGNYSMINSGISPKELLFYLTAPPDFPEELFGMTSIAVQNTISDNSIVGVELINNFINRILLSQSDNFTYQDEVYIENLLRELGINDISLFMKQIKNITDEQLDIHELIKLYQQELKLREALPLSQEKREEKKDSLHETPEPKSHTLPYYLHSDIYRRLDTAAIYDIVNSFQQDQSKHFGSFHNKELRTAEQLSVSRLLSLSELREKILAGQSLYLQHSLNHFELGDILPPPENEGEVLSRAAAAGLVSLVENILVQEITRKGSLTNLWLNLEGSFSETIQNSISRFQSYHSGDTSNIRKTGDISLETRNLYKSEASILEEIISIREQLFLYGDRVFSSSPEQPDFLKLEQLFASSNALNLEGDSSFYYDEQGNIIINEQESGSIQTKKPLAERGEPELAKLLSPQPPLSEASAQKAPPPLMMEHPEGDTPLAKPEEDDSNSTEKPLPPPSKDIAELAKKALGSGFSPSVPTYGAVPPPISEEALSPPPFAKEAELTRGLRAGKELLRELLLVQRQNVFQSESSEMAPSTYTFSPRFESLQPLLEKTVFKDSYQKLRETFQTAEEGPSLSSPYEAPSMKVPLEEPSGEISEPSKDLPSYTAPSDSEAPAELIARELYEINQRNRERFETIQAVRMEKISDSIPLADTEKTMSEALRALESPEAFIKELMGTPSPNPPPLSPEALAYLEGADPATRQIAEAVLRYEKDPSAALGSGLLKPSNVGEFNSATRQHPSPSETEDAPTPPEAHSKTERFTNRTDRVLEHYSRSNEPVGTKFSPTETPPRVPIVHKVEQSQFSEEFFEQLRQEQQKKTTETTVSESFSSKNIQEIEHETVNKQVIAQTSQDITELVNRTLAKQMNSISDKVYRQMEKKLQTERSRRGRF
ncbi:MAG: hypothetical protein GX025_06410 [Clostridiales bacterium]|nr:hypothetical protein [Clostridiales bacterium]